MSHFAVLVVMPEGHDETTDQGRAAMYEEAEQLLAPYSEDGEWFKDGSRWDWWSVGGRWSGALDNFDPYDLDINWERCDLCGGTGTRNVPIPGQPDWKPTPGECNGCTHHGGKVGFRRKWFTEPYSGDYSRVEKARAAAFVPFAVVTPEDGWIGQGRMGWWGVTIPDEEKAEPSGEDKWGGIVASIFARYGDRRCVLVDCHV